MAPQTRSATKFSPGRSTRNSIFGRAPPPTPKPRSSLPNKSPTRLAQAHDHDAEDKVTPNASDKKGIPWLACRDTYGVVTTIAMSETGEGIHVRWYYPEDDCEVDEDEDEEADVEMIVDEDRGVTPGPVEAAAGLGNVVRRPFPETPMALQPYDAGSVVLTPVKKARPLVRSPLRIGDKGVRCLYERDGVLRDLNGCARIVLRHPVGSTANLSREQVERLQQEQEEKIIRVQVEKLLAEKQRAVEEEEMYFADSGYEDERDSAASFFRGPNGEMLDSHGRQLLGREGTILVDFVPESTEPTEIIDRSSVDCCVDQGRGLRRARFGPEGTELIN